jgi:hypothetical protein
MGDALDITVRRERGVVIAAVAGGVDISTAARLRECLSGLADGRDADRGPEPRHVHRFGWARGAGRRGPPRRRARRQPACGLRPAAHPQAVVADRGGPPDSARGHRGRGADVPGGVPGRSRLVAPGQLACRGHRDAEQAPGPGPPIRGSPRPTAVSGQVPRADRANQWRQPKHPAGPGSAAARADDTRPVRIYCPERAGCSAPAPSVSSKRAVCGRSDEAAAADRLGGMLARFASPARLALHIGLFFSAACRGLAAGLGGAVPWTLPL